MHGRHLNLVEVELQEEGVVGSEFAGIEIPELEPDPLYPPNPRIRQQAPTPIKQFTIRITSSQFRVHTDVSGEANITKDRDEFVSELLTSSCEELGICVHHCELTCNHKGERKNAKGLTYGVRTHRQAQATAFDDIRFNINITLRDVRCTGCQLETKYELKNPSGRRGQRNVVSNNRARSRDREVRDRRDQDQIPVLHAIPSQNEVHEDECLDPVSNPAEFEEITAKLISKNPELDLVSVAEWADLIQKGKARFNSKPPNLPSAASVPTLNAKKKDNQSFFEQMIQMNMLQQQEERRFFRQQQLQMQQQQQQQQQLMMNMFMMSHGMNMQRNSFHGNQMQRDQNFGIQNESISNANGVVPVDVDDIGQEILWGMQEDFMF